MSDKKKTPPLVRFALLFVATIATWIVLGAFRTFTVEPAQEVPSEILEPLDPSLDSNALNEIQRRISLSEDEIGDTVVFSTSESVPFESGVDFSAPFELNVATEGGVNEQ